MTTQVCDAAASDWRKSPSTRFFQDGDDASKPLRDALNKPPGAVEEDTWRVGVLGAFRALVEKRLPWPLPAACRPAEGEPTPLDAALHYRVAAEFVCRFPTRAGQKYRPFVSTGMLLDLWDIWRKAGSPDEVERRPVEQVPPLRDGNGRVVEPALILDALCGCDRDLAFLLSENGEYGAENALREQMRWQLRRLYRSKDRFSKADRALLYELLRHDHYRFSDPDTHLPEDSVERLILAAEQFRASVENFGETPLPETPEAAFADDRGDQEQQDRTIDALRIFFAHGASGEKDTAFGTLPQRLQAAAKKLEIDVDETNLRRMLLFWAARSRIVRMALDDLLDHRFPKTESQPPEQQKIDAVSGCDCWIAVTGYRQVGKTSFMAALTTALLPDDTPLDGDLEKVEWSESRARVVETSAFMKAGTRGEALSKGAQGVRQLIVQRLKGVETQGTPEEIQHIAEVDTAYLARLRFFDLPGEHLYDETTGKMNDQTEEMIKRRGPVAAIFLESADDDDQQLDRRKFLPEIVGPVAPIYIVMNKYDAFRDKYSGNAKREMSSSLSCDDTPMEHDADYGVKAEPFFSLRQIDLQEENVASHHDIIKRLDDIPAVVRRPHYYARLVADIERLGWLFDDYLLKWGNRDISIAYLVSTLDGRAKPKEFRGLRRLWEDIEYRVVESTRDVRRSALRRLLIEAPAEAEKRATEAYDSFNAAFDREATSENEPVNGMLPAYWDKFKLQIDKGLNELQRDRRRIRGIFWGATLYNPHQTTIKALKQVKDALGCSRLIASKHAHLTSIESALRAFLPELGINPDSQFGELPTIALVRALQSAELSKFKELSEDICEQIRKSLDEKGVSFDEHIGGHVNRLLETVIKEFRKDMDSGARKQPDEAKKETKFRVAFGLREGVEHPKEHPGHGVPVRDSALNLRQRKMLTQNIVRNQTVADEILNHTSADESLALVLSLYNTDESQGSRYPYLMLRKGDVDFGRVRVLSEQNQLGQKFFQFREKAVDAIELMLQAQERIRRLDTDSLASIKILRVADTKIFGGHLGLMGTLPLSSGDGPNAMDLPSTLADLHKRAKELCKELMDRIRRRKLFSHKWDQVRDLGTEYARSWSLLDAESRPSMDKGGRAKGLRRTVMKALARMDVKVGLLEALVEVANNVRDTETQWIQEDVENRLQLDAALRHKLLELRVARRLLIVGYPLTYLFENHWIQSAEDVARRDKTGRTDKETTAITEIVDRLEKARQALNKMNLRLVAAGEEAKERSQRGAGTGDRSERIGSPAFPLIALKKDEGTGRAWIDDDEGNWEALCDALGLSDPGAGEHPLWRSKS